MNWTKRKYKFPGHYVFISMVFVIVNFANALYYQVKNFPLKISLVKIKEMQFSSDSISFTEEILK